MRYGPEGQAFPVRSGDVWRVGRHTFRCGSIFDYAPEEFVTLVYCDPPWGNGILSMFHGAAGLARPEYDWTAIYRRVIEIGQGSPLWLEVGLPGRDQVRSMLHGVINGEWDVKYGRDRPSVLFYSGPTLPRTPDLTGLHDDHLPGIVMSSYPPGIVCDPCAGRGLTSRAAERLGWQSVNNELNPLRVSAALARMQRMTGTEPRRISDDREHP